MSAWKKQAVPLVFLEVAMGSLVATNGHIDAVQRVHKAMECAMSSAWSDINRRAYPISREQQQRTISVSALAMRKELAKLWMSGVEHVTELPYGMLFVAEEVLRMMPKDRWPEGEKAWRLIACLCLALCRMTDPRFVDLDGTERGESIRNIVMWEAA